MQQDYIKDSIYGLTIGDAFGVPFEFMHNRSYFLTHKVNDMCALSKEIVKGSWSDDTSLALALMDSLINNRDINYKDICDNFVLWLGNGKYTPTGIRFGEGVATTKAIYRYVSGVYPTSCGSTDQFENGNGSLMRILPLLFYLRKRFGDNFLNDKLAMQIVNDTTRLTHGHVRSLIASGIYLSFVNEIINSREKKNGEPLTFIELKKAIRLGSDKAFKYYENDYFSKAEINFYIQLKRKPKREKLYIETILEREINSDAYVVNTLLTITYIVMKSPSYEKGVKRGLYLSGDTDTNCSLIGGLLGLAYGFNSIPKKWVKDLQNPNMINDFIKKFSKKYR